MIGLRELALIGLVVLVLYGRSGVLKSRRFQTIWPWISPVRRTTGRPGPARTAGMTHPQQGARGASLRPSARRPHFLLEGNRLFWFLTVLAATAVAAWIVGRALYLSGTGPALAH